MKVFDIHGGENALGKLPEELASALSGLLTHFERIDEEPGELYYTFATHEGSMFDLTTVDEKLNARISRFNRRELYCFVMLLKCLFDDGTTRVTLLFEDRALLVSREMSPQKDYVLMLARARVPNHSHPHSGGH